jgi:hypothetical protein
MAIFAASFMVLAHILWTTQSSFSYATVLIGGVQGMCSLRQLHSSNDDLPRCTADCTHLDGPGGYCTSDHTELLVSELELWDEYGLVGNIIVSISPFDYERI